MHIADIESLVTETLIENEDFQEDFCAGCESVRIEYGYRYCRSEFTPSDGGCARRKDWDRISTQIHKLADIAGD